MQTTVALLSMAAAAFAAPQSVGGANTQPAPAGCSPNYSGSFGITAVNITLPNSKRDLDSIVERQSNTGSGGATGPLVITLAGGVLSDSQNRVGNIVANHQFQFDPKPGQAGAIYTGGFSVCSNGSLALGSSAVFYSCLGSQPVSQGGFFNLYDTPAGNLCNPVLLVITPSGGSGSGGAVPQKTDGQPAVTGAAQKTDGQVVATPVAQKSDGQIIAPTAAAQKSDGQVIVASVAPPQVAQISDGQLQVVSIMQKSDGQVIAPTQGGVAQKSDGQVVATPAAGGVSQKSDGQIVATPAPVAQKSDGQIVATPAGAPVAQKSDGQPIATGAPAKNSTSPPLQVTNSASSFGLASGAVAIFAGVIAVAFL